ncbi:MAG: hypothetical protein R3F22_09295 [Lysobacteraceae bacterium]
MKTPIALLFCAALLAVRTASADPLNISLSDATPDPVFIGYSHATFAILVEPTASGASVNNLSGSLGPLGLYGGLQLVSHDCPGTFTASGFDFLWSGVPDLGSGQSIDCSVQLRPTQPTTHMPVEMRLSMGCTGCSNDANDRDSGLLDARLAPDVVATIASNPNPPIGSAGLVVTLHNEGDATAHDINASLFGTASLFTTMTPDGVGKCLTGLSTAPGEVSWEVAFLDPGEVLTCPFSFTIPSPGSYSLNILAPGYTEDSIPEPDMADNSQNLTINATSLVVNTQYSFYPDDNPGDGICADSNNGACSLRAAIEEANALSGHQVISVPYPDAYVPATYYANNLIVTDTVTISGVPDAVSGAWPVITRTGSTDTALLRIDTGTASQTVFRHLDLRGNSAYESSINGAVVQQWDGGLWIRESRISQGRTTGWGGGIGGTEGLRLTAVEIFDNQAEIGGGLSVQGVYNNGIVDAILEDVAIHDNQADYGGGAQFFNADTRIHRSSFVDNDADDSGGGFAVSTGADVQMENSTVSGNSAALRGGGIYHSQGALSVGFSTIVYNVAGPGDTSVGDGGGIWTSSTTVGNTDIGNSILAFNTARTTGGMFGTVVSGNCHGVLDSSGYNTIAWIDGDPDCSVGTVRATDDYNTAPALAALETTDHAVGFHRLTRVNNEIDQAAPACGYEPSAGPIDDILRQPRPREGDGIGEAHCDRGAVESVPMSLHIGTSESGPAAWQILLDGGRPACLDAQCDYYFIPVGSQVTLTPDPSPGTSFDGWSGDCSGTGNCVLQMSESRNVGASFSASGHTLTVSKSGAGNVTSSPAGISCGANCTEAYATGTDVTLTATPSAGWALQTWSGDCSGIGACVVTMDGPRSVSAVFGEAWSLDVSIVGNGSVSSSPAGIACPGDCNEDYADGAEITLTPSADPGFAFDHWSGDCSGSGACVVQIDQPRNVIAHFVADATAIFANGFE